MKFIEHRMGNVLKEVFVSMWNGDHDDDRCIITHSCVIYDTAEDLIETAFEMGGRMVRFTFPYKPSDSVSKTLNMWGVAAWQYADCDELREQLHYDKVLINYVDRFLLEYIRQGLVWHVYIDKSFKRKVI